MSKLFYKSTRGAGCRLTSSEAIIKGIASDGGLYVPESIPQIDRSLKNLSDMDYRRLALYIMSKFFNDFSSRELEDCISRAYDSKFDTPVVAPLVEKDGVFFLELFHGPTLAFKDMALSILPHLLKAAVKKNGLDREVVILVATSGDTGKAALEGFADIEGTNPDRRQYLCYCCGRQL
jgi:threonine synthase